MRIQIAFYDRQRALIVEQIRAAEADMDKSWKQDAASQRSLRNYIQTLQADLERSARKEAPERERLRLTESIGPMLAGCHKELFKAIPAALSSYSPPKLSPALFAAVKKRLQNDPQYAAHFQKQMRISPDTLDRERAEPGALQIGSAQGLDLFLAAGDALPKAERATLIGKARVNPHPAAFNVNTAPLFAKLANDYGVELGPEQGLKFEGTSRVQDLEAAIGLTGLSAAIQEAVAPPAARDRRGFSFSAADCDEKVSRLSAH
jgi:hypothetical protein